MSYSSRVSMVNEPARPLISGSLTCSSILHEIPTIHFCVQTSRSVFTLLNMSVESVEEEKIATPSHEALQEALDLMKKAYDIMKEQAVDVRKEREAFDSVAKKLEHVHFASTIKLNVGGQYFTTSLQTLTKDTGSMLHAMFSGRFDTKPAEDGSYFIDRDGTNFRYILNYLRTGRLLLPEDKLVREELLEEAEFYQIRGIVDELRNPPNLAFKDSTILAFEQKQVFVNNWLKGKLQNGHSDFVLIYRASRDGWSCYNFHALCDSKGPTVTVVKSGNNIFGGYTEQSWDGKQFYLGITGLGRWGGGVDGRHELWDRETLFSQLAKRSPCVVASG